ncbi:MAG: serine/threonine protein kinase [Planctomycetes bacterium]|nr:serine/threonine protein kinase [Planctomycetota bacterium]
MTAPPLGQLALQARLVDERRLDGLLRGQARRRAEGDVRWLGDLLRDSMRVAPAQLRPLLRRQGLELLACARCRARFGAVGRPDAPRTCLRCGAPLARAPEDAPLGTEDTLDDGTPEGRALLEAHRRRAPPFGPFLLLGELGRGGMGVIYKAWDPRAGLPVALKLVQRPAAASFQDQARFRREARAIAALRHEHIVASRGLEEADGFSCIVMDYVAGVTLDLLLAHGAVDRARATQICARVARALDHAHQAGIVHRDVKPQNVLVARDGRPYLFDFGVAKMGDQSSSLTSEGVALGSLGFMAPEYLLGGSAAVGPACDVYALGVTLFLAVTGGRHPIGDPAAHDFVVRAIEQRAAPALSVAPDLPPALARALDRALAREPADRHPTAAALADDLERALPG